MNFGEAIQWMKEGHGVARTGWNGVGMWIQIQWPDQSSKMQLPYIYICPVGGALVPWVASHTDLLADDWVPA